MLKKYIYTAIFLIISSISGYSQYKLKNFTQSITDVSQSEYDQARDIYNWVTSNIKYDLKKVNSFDHSLIRAEDMLKKKKGDCHDFANLYEQMCLSINIETYSIKGYSKVLDYYPGFPFLRANHVWNVVRTDSDWIMVDVTSGSGNPSPKPSIIDKFIELTSHSPVAKNYWKTKSRSYYFDVPKDSIWFTHYPLDPKWLFTSTPLTYESFIFDTVHTTFNNTSYLAQIKEIRTDTNNHQHKIEGIKAESLNPLNKFDFSSGSLMVAENYDLERNILEYNLEQFEEYLEEFRLINNSINTHRSVSDSLYRIRFSELKSLASRHKKLTNKIISRTKSAKKSNGSVKKQNSDKGGAYDKKLSDFMINAGKTEIKKLLPQAPKGNFKVDSAALLEYKISIAQLEESMPRFIEIQDSIRAEVDKHLKEDVFIIDSIMANNELFNEVVATLKAIVLTGDEFAIHQHTDSLIAVHEKILYLFDYKKNSKKMVEASGREYFNNVANLQKVLKQQQSLYNKSFKTSNHNNDYLDLHNSVIDRIVESYTTAIEFTHKLSRHTTLQDDNRQQTYDALKEQQKHIKDEYKHFELWYSNLYQREKSRHKDDKALIAVIRTKSLKKLKYLEMKINKYKKSQEESN